MPDGAITHRTPKKWLRITVTCDPVMSDALVSHFTGFTGSGVEILPVPEDDAGRSEQESSVLAGYGRLGLTKATAEKSDEWLALALRR